MSLLSLLYSKTLITSVSHVGRFHDLGICHLCYVGSHVQSKDIRVKYHMFRLSLGKLGGSHGVIHMKSLFIPALFTGTTIHSNIGIDNTDIIIKFVLFIICTGVDFFLIFKFHPMKVK
jgi:hypothetical protein